MPFSPTDPERAATLLGAAQAIFDETGAVPDPDDRVEMDNLRGKLQGHEDAVARGCALDVDAALALALD